MKILIDIGHPAHVHYFKNAAKELISMGHQVLFTCREKEFEKELLEANGFEYISFGKKYNSLSGKIIGMIKFDIKEFITGLKFKPDVFLSAGSIYAAHAAFLLRKPHIALEDTFNMEQIRLYLPFTSVVLTGNYEHPSLGKKEIRYNGYQELAYLHPKRFKPEKSILRELGVSEDNKYVILRFVAWNATHDIGHHGISYENKIKAVKEFEKYAKVFISSESALPDELKKYKIKVNPNRMHDALTFAELLFSESATMASESAILGTPAIYIDNKGRFYTKNQEQKYGLCFNYTESEEDQIKAIKKVTELLTTSNLKDQWQEKRKKMLENVIDVTSFLVWFIEHFPVSMKIMKENPDYQYNFK